MGELYRVLEPPGGDGRNKEPVVVPLDEWLDDLMAEREACIQRLRSLERPLVRYGRIKAPTLGQRVR